MKNIKRFSAAAAALAVFSLSALTFAGCAQTEDSVVLRVCSWEEYIDLGGWDDDELIEIDNPYTETDGVFGENSMVDDFTEWFNANHDYNVKVEYSTFGTNEDLYNRLSLGDVYDLICPSDYMIMKLLAEDKCINYSKDFWDTEKEDNYYAQYVSPYIDGLTEGIFNNPEYNWHQKAACYMWGTTGIVYNPEKIADQSDVSRWDILLNDKYNRQVTVKDNVRDAYFAALGIVNYDKLTSSSVTEEERNGMLNNVEKSAISAAEDVLKQIKENVYSFETDSGKADMVTGKVIANYQWSGDAVYIMDEAESDEVNPTELWYSVPDECANLWFDGWLMLKDGIDGNARRQEAAEAFVNFLSRPDNAVRNMYYIGYTSAIAGDVIYDYMDYNYGAEEGAEVLEYDLSYFFGEDTVIEADAANFIIDQNGQVNRGRQLFAQYPPQNVIERSVVMLDFGDKLSEINQMWINVRCLDLKDISPLTYTIAAGIVIFSVLGICLYVFRDKIFIKK